MRCMLIRFTGIILGLIVISRGLSRAQDPCTSILEYGTYDFYNYSNVDELIIDHFKRMDKVDIHNLQEANDFSADLLSITPNSYTDFGLRSESEMATYDYHKFLTEDWLKENRRNTVVTSFKQKNEATIRAWSNCMQNATGMIGWITDNFDASSFTLNLCFKLIWDQRPTTRVLAIQADDRYFASGAFKEVLNQDIGKDRRTFRITATKPIDRGQTFVLKVKDGPDLTLLLKPPVKPEKTVSIDTNNVTFWDRCTAKDSAAYTIVNSEGSQQYLIRAWATSTIYSPGESTVGIMIKDEHDKVLQYRKIFAEGEKFKQSKPVWTSQVVRVKGHSSRTFSAVQENHQGGYWDVGMEIFVRAK